MRRPARGLRHLALIAAALGTAGSARAHGPAPVALEVLAHDGRTPSVVRTNVGLAVANGDGTYGYVCPSRWDGNELALAAASRGGELLLVHSAGVAYLSRDRGCTFAPITSDALYVTAAASTEQGFLLIAEEYPTDADPNRSVLLRVTADGALESAAIEVPGSVDGLLASPEGVLLAGHAPLGFLASETRVISTFETTASLVTPRAFRGGEAWLRTTEGGNVALLRVGGDGEAIPTSLRGTSVHGPIVERDRWVALFDGALFELDGGEWAYVEEVTWTCLKSLEDRNFACHLSAMHELGPWGLMDATPVFSMAQLGPPAACGDAAARQACDLDWAHFGGEAGWLETRPATSPTAPRRPPAGCAIAPGPAPGLPLPIATALALRLRALRSRRAAPRSSAPRPRRRPSRGSSASRASGCPRPPSPRRGAPR